MSVMRNRVIAGLLLAACSSCVNAGIVVSGTRVIFNGAKKEAAINVSNPDQIPYLIQSWIEPPTGSTEKAPFIITPPLFRLDKGQQNTVRIVRKGSMPEDKESLYWIDIKGIPSAPRRENTLQIAVKTRFKLIYRPASLVDVSLEDQAGKLVWQKMGSHIQVKNPTPYVINFNVITVNGKEVDDVSYVLPGTTATFALPANAANGDVTFKIINDYGGIGEVHRASI